MNEVVTGNNSTVMIDDRDTITKNVEKTINNTTINKTITVIKAPSKSNRTGQTKNDIIIANQEMILKKLDILLAENNIVIQEVIVEDDTIKSNIAE